MGLVKFLTFCDDETNLILTPDRLKNYNISLCPCSYRYNDKIYHSMINTNAEEYSKLIKDTGSTFVSVDFIKYMYELASKIGYLSLFVICPHSKYSECYKTAMLAKKSFYRTHNSYDEIEIKVIDSKTLGIGTMLFALQTALSYSLNYNDRSMIALNARKKAEKAKTFILTYESVSYPVEKQIMRTYLLSGSKLKELDISQSVSEVRYDYFSDIVCKSIKNSDGKYSVSFGYDCNFVGNVLGRIKMKSKVNPIVVAKYGILTASALGSEALCVHIG